MNKIDMNGWVIILSHLVITIIVLAMYGVSVYQGHPDDTLRNIITLIIGYWFGSMGSNAIKTITQSKTTSDTKDTSNNG